MWSLHDINPTFILVDRKLVLEHTTTARTYGLPTLLSHLFDKLTCRLGKQPRPLDKQPRLLGEHLLHDQPTLLTCQPRLTVSHHPLGAVGDVIPATISLSCDPISLSCQPRLTVSHLPLGAVGDVIPATISLSCDPISLSCQPRLTVSHHPLGAVDDVIPAHIPPQTAIPHGLQTPF